MIGSERSAYERVERHGAGGSMERWRVAHAHPAVPHLQVVWSQATIDESERLLDIGQREDFGTGSARDLTSELLLDRTATGAAVIRSRGDGVVAGLPVLPLIAKRFSLRAFAPKSDGPVRKGEVVARLEGTWLDILAAERLTLNYLNHLSGVATLTAKYVAEVDAVTPVNGRKAVICDTRKTTIGWRHLEKYAVTVGGGFNHRFGLFDAVLIKDNHLAALEPLGGSAIARAVELARTNAPEGTVIEVEVDTLEQLEEALAIGPDIVLLDNMSIETLRRAVERRDQRNPNVLLEVSGGVNLGSVGAIAALGVDRISVGALTHSAPSFDLGLDEAGDS